MEPAVVDEEAGGSLGGPEELGEARLDLLVQEADPLFEEPQLLGRQGHDDP